MKQFSIHRSAEPRGRRLCFVAPNAYPALTGNASVKHIGGAEVQQAAIGRGLAGRGYQVSFITLDHGQAEPHDAGGVAVHKAYRLNAGLPILRFVHPRITGIWSAMGRANADIYYQRTSDSVTGVVAAFCRWHGRKFVYGVAHDADTISELPNCPARRERVLYRYGLSRASMVIAQTYKQQAALQQHFSVESIVIHNAVAVEHDSPAKPRRSERPRILWVGRFVKVKRIEWLFQVARLCPEMDFLVCGDGCRSDYVRTVQDLVQAAPNVTMVGAVPHEELFRQYYTEADALLCTSVAEGFPNTFLEAWSFGIPVATTFDPDGLVAEYALGQVAHEVDGLAEGLRGICNVDKPDRRAERLCNYVREHHSLASRLDRYEEVFRQL